MNRKCLYVALNPSVVALAKIETLCYRLSRLQSVLNAAARLIFSARRSDHTTPLLRELHWLRIPERIQFRLCVLTYRCLHGTAPSYLADSLRRCADTEGRRRLRSSVTDTLVLTSTNRTL